MFSGFDEKLTQWRYLYGRLPYVLVYLWCILEHIGETLSITVPEYMLDVHRRIVAMMILSTLRTVAINQQLAHFAVKHEHCLNTHCAERGFRNPRMSDLKRMALTAAFLGEPDADVARRLAGFHAGKERSDSAPPR